MKKGLKTFAICVLAIIVLAVAQSIALLVGELVSMIGAPKVLEPIIDAILYPLLSFGGLKLIVGKRNNFSLKKYRICLLHN